jgi:hypothetical protein
MGKHSQSRQLQRAPSVVNLCADPWRLHRRGSGIPGVTVGATVSPGHVPVYTVGTAAVMSSQHIHSKTLHQLME